MNSKIKDGRKMSRLSNGFMAAHLAELMKEGKVKQAVDAERLLPVGIIRARTIFEIAVEKYTAWMLSHFPKPNHENALKEINR